MIKGFNKNDDLILSIVNSFLMMAGEISGIDSIVTPYINGELEYGTITIFFLIISVIFLPIIMINLMVRNTLNFQF